MVYALEVCSLRWSVKVGFFKISAPLCHICCLLLKRLEETGQVINILITGWHHWILVCYKETLSQHFIHPFITAHKSQMPSLSMCAISQIVLGSANSAGYCNSSFFLFHCHCRTHEWLSHGNLINITIEKVQQHRPSVKRRNDTSASFRKQGSLSHFDI